MRTLANLLLFIGAVGLGGLLSVNFYELIGTSDPTAAFLDGGWWADFAIFYVVMMTILVVGVVTALRSRRGPGGGQSRSTS